GSKGGVDPVCPDQDIGFVDDTRARPAVGESRRDTVTMLLEIGKSQPATEMPFPDPVAHRLQQDGLPHFVLPPNLYMGPPVGGTFWFQIFIQASSPEICRKTIFGGEGGCWRGSGVACFGATSFGKNYRRRDRDRLVPPRWMDAAVYRAEVCYPFGGKHGSH